MIFVTVGTQLPFDRLLAAIDHWAEVHPDQEVIAQTGQSGLVLQNIVGRGWMNSSEFEESIRRAELVVTHAGMGTILTARRFEVPVLVMPRLARLSEIRTDHQRSTARRLEELGLVSVAWVEDELPGRIDELLRGGSGDQRGASTRLVLLSAVREYVLKAVNSK